MSSMRRAVGMVGRPGGVATQDGAAARTNGLGIVRPAFAVSAKTGQRGAIGGPGGPWLTSLGHPLFTLGNGDVSAWRLIAVGLAFAYVVGFHVSLGRTRLGIGPGK